MAPLNEVYMVAALCGGGVHAVGVAVCALVLADRVRVSHEYTLAAVDGDGLVGIEAEVFAEIARGEPTGFGDLLPRLVDTSALRDLRRRLNDLRLTHPSRDGRPVNRLRTRHGDRVLGKAQGHEPGILLDPAGRPVAPAVAAVALGSLADLPDKGLAEAIFGAYWKSGAGFDAYGDWGWPHGSAMQVPGGTVVGGGYGGG